MSHRHAMRVVALLVVVWLSLPWSASAQAERRWLADPALLVGQRTVGPGGSRQFLDTIADLYVQNSTSGWALSSTGILRYDGRHWRLYNRTPSTTFLNALDFAQPQEGWLVGSTTSNIGRSTPPIDTIIVNHWDGTQWGSPAPITPKPGSTYDPLRGSLGDVVTIDNRTALAVGYQRDDHSKPIRPLALAFDGTAWRDISDARWTTGRLTGITMVSRTEGWITGSFEQANGSPRPVILHYKDGIWTEASLPAMPADLHWAMASNITMRDASEGWALLEDYRAVCTRTTFLHYTSGRWTIVPPETYGHDPIIAFGMIPGTNKGWATQSGCREGTPSQPNRRLRFDQGTFTLDVGGAQLAPTRYALKSEQIQWGAANGSIMRYSSEVLPTARVANSGRERYFETTGHTLSGAFRRYYESHGLELGDRGISARESLALFGYPLSEPFEEVNPDTGQVLQVQYFERARMEYHPDNPEPYTVLLGRLTVPNLLRRTNNSEPQPGFPAGPVGSDCERFEATGYDLCPPLRSFWNRNGGLPVFGYPITAAREEVSQTDGATYVTQYFERERLEYHPEQRDTPYETLLGLLGAEELRTRGYLPY
ncbi:MAG TPA: hypothetical protein VGD58_11740 [Herpetosiphonaceae bacterium]